MASTRRVAIYPRGEYVSGEEYDRLDLVHYGENSYLARKANKDILPTNEEYWMLLIDHDITSLQTAITQLDQKVQEHINSITELDPILLLTGATSVTFTLTEPVPDNAKIFIFANKPSVSYEDITTTDTGITVTFEAQQEDIYVKATIES